MSQRQDRANMQRKRALELHDKGLTPTQIAERLGMPSRQHVSTMIKRARERREREKGGAE
jgi:transcriptional regulator